MMRGIAALMVAYFHIARGNVNFLDNSSFFFKLGAYGWAGVEIFFVISGFIVTYAMHYGGYTLSRVHRFVGKRLIRLEPPYIASIILVLVLMYVSTLSPYYRGAPFDPDWGNVFSHLGYINAFTGEPWMQDVYWSLAIEFEFYLGLALLFPLLMHKNKFVKWAVMAALLAMSYIPTGHAHVFQYLPFFCMGIFYSMFRAEQLDNIPFYLFFAGATVICYLSFDKTLCALGLLTVAIIAWLKSAPKPLVFLGHISYSLYLLHIPIGGRIINISEVLVKNHDLRVLILWVTLAVCIVCSWFFYRWVEKPFQKWSKNIKY